MRMSRVALVILVIIALVSAACFSSAHPAALSFTMEQIKSYPFPNELTVSATGSALADLFFERRST